MQLRVGFEMIYRCPQPTPMVVALSIHPSRDADLVRGDELITEPAVAVTRYVDLFSSRFCETELLTKFAWQQFAGLPAGWATAGTPSMRATTCRASAAC